jgi:hypothetical protein
MARILTGDKALDRALGEIKESAANKLVRPAMAKALRTIAKAIRQEVPSQYKQAKRGIGARFNKAKRGGNPGQITAKAGVGVGIKKKALEKINAKLNEARAYKRFKKRNSKKGGSIAGVGIGPSNVHWFVLGTKQRKHKSGKSTGAMRPVMENIVKDGFAKSSSTALSEMKSTVKSKLDALVKVARAK